MSLLLRTVESFPRGRTTEELLVLAGAGFTHDKRLAALAELDGLLRDGLIEKGRDGKWRASKRGFAGELSAATRHSGLEADASSDELIAAPAAFVRCPAPAEESSDLGLEDVGERLDHQALLRYWRSALRADPRGATTQVADKHGVEWSLLSGRGPVAPTEGESLTITIALEALAPSFREAIVRREGHENALAIGWPIAVTRVRGVPAFQPVGLLSGAWERRENELVVTVGADDVLVNPDWLREASRRSGWRRDALKELFEAEDGVGLRASDFVVKLQDAVASQIRGRIAGQDLSAKLDVSSPGIFDSAAIFLPTDSSFTAGAARDLDAIATWSAERVSRTALAAVFGMTAQRDDTEIAAINVGDLNREQTTAVRNACSAPLSVVTGPPGTGKSQAIVSMAASVLLSGGSVLVASKNHQALDAVEDRLGSLAPDVPFVTRTLKPEEEVDSGFADALKELVERESTGRAGHADEAMVAELKAAARERSTAIDTLDELADLECEIAELLERIEYRESLGRQYEAEDTPDAQGGQKLWRRLFTALIRLVSKQRDAAQPSGQASSRGISLPELCRRLERVRAARQALPVANDPIALGQRVRDLSQAALPKAVAGRAYIDSARRREIAEAYDEWSFAGGKGSLPHDLALTVLEHRPLWLASILGTPRRVPLSDGLFDLVIFDEASQCDIATAIPLFARAKRAVVVGDDQQLSFIAQLGRAQDRNLIQAQGLPVTKMARFAQSSRSLFDFASRIPNAPQITLCHQYRSAGPIVDYISDYFYGGQLATSYDPATLEAIAASHPASQLDELLPWNFQPSN